MIICMPLRCHKPTHKLSDHSADCRFSALQFYTQFYSQTTL